jgi:hypothetical protein
MRDASLFKIAPLVADIRTSDSSRPVMTYCPTSKKSPSQRARQVLVSWPGSQNSRTHPTNTWHAFAILQAISTIPSKAPQAYRAKWGPIDSYVLLRSGRELYL